MCPFYPAEGITVRFKKSYLDSTKLRVDLGIGFRYWMNVGWCAFAMFFYRVEPIICSFSDLLSNWTGSPGGTAGQRICCCHSPVHHPRVKSDGALQALTVLQAKRATTAGLQHQLCSVCELP